MEKMTTDRIKEIQEQTAHPDSKHEQLRSDNVALRFSLWWGGLIGTAKAKIWWYKGRLKNYAWFQIRAWNALRGKEMIIDSRQVKSNGGFLYRQLEISKCPLSKTECVG